MRTNIEATRGAVFAERAMTLLAPKMGRDVAHKIVEEASRKSVAQEKQLSEVLAQIPEVTANIEPSALRQLEVPERYLGSAEIFRQALVSSARGNSKQEK
jgi:3-carboxy-cis,cis-muconate cycloisomerase